MSYFDLEGLELPSLNRLLRMHWAARKRLQREIGWRLRAAWGRERIREARGAVARRARVTIVQRRRRRMDPDNAAGACKLLLDELVATGLLVDDSPRWLELEVQQETLQGREPCVTVTIEWEHV